MYSYLRVVFVTVFFVASLSGDEMFFMPVDAKKAQDRVVKRIEGAKEGIYVGMYSFTNKEIAKALKNASNKGVKIVIVVDEKAGVEDKFSKVGELAKLKNVEAYVAKGVRSPNDKYDGKMHAKIMSVDGESCIFGSVNWSFTGFGVNYEVMYESLDKAIVSRCEAYIKEIASRGRIY